MSGYPQNRLITLWRIDAELLVCHLSPSGVFSPTPVFILAIPARLLLTATRCQCAASGLSRDGRLYRSGPASL
ncbi:hypothetical protein [Citrobacter braakii]|uniref:hypothetical protein n=1 Tax=Citrobacter braakii TaxID=57706 RepID=UPI00351D6871